MARILPRTSSDYHKKFTEFPINNFVGTTEFVICKIKSTFDNPKVMCWSEFFILMAVAAVVFLIILFLFNVVVVHSSYFLLNLGAKIYHCITWPFRALWNHIPPHKKKKDQHFRNEDDDIEIHF